IFRILHTKHHILVPVLAGRHDGFHSGHSGHLRDYCTSWERLFSFLFLLTLCSEFIGVYKGYITTQYQKEITQQGLPLSSCQYRQVISEIPPSPYRSSLSAIQSTLCVQPDSQFSDHIMV